MTRRTGRAAVCAALAFGLAAGGAPSAFAETIHVAAGGDIAAAVERANNDDVVELAPGTYMLSATVTVDKPITVRGRFAACTTVTASGTGYSLFKLTDEGAVLERVTLTGATATSGAGVYVTKGTVRDAVVVGNRATSGGNAGAGVWLSGTGCAVRRCRIEKNSTGGYGGGIYAAGASVIESCSLTGNSASYGGGIYCDQRSSVIVAQCTLWANRS